MGECGRRGGGEVESAAVTTGDRVAIERVVRERRGDRRQVEGAPVEAGRVLGEGALGGRYLPAATGLVDRSAVT